MQKIQLYFSAEKKQFYNSDAHKEFPKDAVKISESKWHALLKGQSEGKIIVGDAKGNPTLKTMPAKNIEAVKRLKIAQISAGAESALLKMAAAYPETERASWSEQAREARLMLAGEEGAVLLPAIAAEQGISVTALAAKVIEKATDYAVKTGAIIGRCNALKAQVENAKSKTAVQNIKAIF